MSLFGLHSKTIEQMKSVFSAYPQITKVLIYGSRAKGNFKNGSDIDLTIVGENINFETQLEIENALDNLMLPYKIDLSVFDQIENPDLKDHITRVGKLLYLIVGQQAGPKS